MRTLEMFTDVEAAQQLINNTIDPEQLLREVEDHLNIYTPMGYPGEKEMRIARHLRNLALTPITHESSLRMLRNLYEDRGKLVVNTSAEDDIERGWSNVVLHNDDMALLRTTYHITSDNFDEGVAFVAQTNPSVVDLWHTYGQRVFSTTQEYLDHFRAMDPDEIPKKGLTDLHNLAATPESAQDQARLTNGTTSLLTLAIMTISQRAAGDTMTGNEIGYDLRDNLDRAVGLTAGLRNVVTNKLCEPGDFHDPGHLANLIKADGNYALGVFAQHRHPPKPGKCVGYTLLQPSSGKYEAINKACIAWMRGITNNNTAAYPKDALRATEVNFLLGSFVAEQVWGDDIPFR